MISKRKAIKAIADYFDRRNLSDFETYIDDNGCFAFTYDGRNFSLMTDEDIFNVIDHYVRSEGLNDDEFLNQYKNWISDHIDMDYLRSWLDNESYGQAYDLANMYFEDGQPDFVDMCVTAGLATEEDFEPGGKYLEPSEASDLVYELADHIYDAVIEIEDSLLDYYLEVSGKGLSYIFNETSMYCSIHDFVQYLVDECYGDDWFIDLVGAYYGSIKVENPNTFNVYTRYNLQEWQDGL